MAEKKLVVANWKMNPPTMAEAKRLFMHSKEAVRPLRNVQLVVCPPVIYITELRDLHSGRKTLLGAQDVSGEEGGEHTGSVSASMLKSAGVHFVIVGHSERRAEGETNDDIRKKVNATLENGMSPLICVGERKRDDHGEYLAFIQEEVEAALADVLASSLKHVAVVYEPLWAIGGGADDAVTPEDLHQTTLFIRKILTDTYNKTSAFRARILYGGSVEPGNCGSLLEHGAVDGFLVGHASLDNRAFSAILQSAHASR